MYGKSVLIGDLSIKADARLVAMARIDVGDRFAQVNSVEILARAPGSSMREAVREPGPDLDVEEHVRDAGAGKTVVKGLPDGRS